VIAACPDGRRCVAERADPSTARLAMTDGLVDHEVHVQGHTFVT
jgi:hypothetical protein